MPMFRIVMTTAALSFMCAGAVSAQIFGFEDFSGVSEFPGGGLWADYCSCQHKWPGMAGVSPLGSRLFESRSGRKCSDGCRCETERTRDPSSCADGDSVGCQHCVSHDNFAYPSITHAAPAASRKPSLTPSPGLAPTRIGPTPTTVPHNELPSLIDPQTRSGKRTSAKLSSAHPPGVPGSAPSTAPLPSAENSRSILRTASHASQLPSPLQRMIRQIIEDQDVRQAIFHELP